MGIQFSHFYFMFSCHNLMQILHSIHEAVFIINLLNPCLYLLSHSVSFFPTELLPTVSVKWSLCRNTQARRSGTLGSGNYSIFPLLNLNMHEVKSIRSYLLPSEVIYIVNYHQFSVLSYRPSGSKKTQTEESQN